jgi:diguanylate cyclase (GGDEF)-like protein
MAKAAEAPLSVRDIRLRVLLPVIAATLGAVLLAFAGLWWATTHGDTISVERQRRAIRGAIAAEIDTVAQSQQRVAIGDETALELRKPRPDLARFDAGAAYLHDQFRHDALYILDADDNPIYAMLNGQRRPASGYEDAQADLRRLVDKARGRIRVPSNPHERLPGLPLHPKSSTRTSDIAVHATALVEVLGRPAAASVMLNVPSSEEVERTPGREPLFISLRYLDEAFLQDLSRHHQINMPRFSRIADPGTGEQALPLTAETGGGIRYVLWRPERPGTQMMHSMAPVIAGAFGIMAFAMVLLARLLYRALRQQQTIMAELNASEAQAQHLAIHDVLTGLPNRAMFNGRLDHALARNEPATLLLLDLDRFKSVNDTLGHGAGDLLIREFGERLLGIVRGRDLVARLGGDEFGILCSGVMSTDEVATLCQRMTETVRRPFNLVGTYVSVGVSIGVSTSGNSPANRSELVRKADVALYRAKAEGRDCYRVFCPGMDASVKLHGEIETELREALETGEGLDVHYQPQVACRSGKIVGLEALARWCHPTRGIVSPQQFIAIAEESNQICKLGEWVLYEACRASRRWPELFMAVNFSPMQFRTPGFAERVISIVREIGANPAQIEVEVTESVLLDNDDLVREALAALRAHGFRVALDDFGTGYSSLSYLRRFQVDKIKIDRSFVQPLYQDADAVAIVTAVLTLGHAMGLSVTAEGVETPEQHRFLEAAGCDLMQGFLFSPAVPEEEIAKMVMLPPKVDAA